MQHGAPGSAETSHERDLLKELAELRAENARLRVEAESDLDDEEESVVDDGSWRSQAACRGCNPGMFFPERGDTRGVQAALAVCGECPVREQCLNDNLFEDDGIFGGLSGRQRRSLRSRIGQERPCRTCGSLFRRGQPGQWYCSLDCRNQARRATGKIGL